MYQISTIQNMEWNIWIKYWNICNHNTWTRIYSTCSRHYISN